MPLEMTRDMTRRTALALLSASLARAAGRLPANKNIKWALSANGLFRSANGLHFTDILDVMRDTGFIGVRVTQYPQFLKTYDITEEALEKEVARRNLHIFTISFNGPAYDAARRQEVLASARAAMTFLKRFGADRLVVFSPNRNAATGDAAFRTMCECFNQIGEIAGEMGFKAGLHNHVGQMVQEPEEIDKCMALTDPKLFWFSPDTAHLYLAKSDPAATLAKYKSRLMMMDYKDAKRTHPFSSTFSIQDIYDLGAGEIDFPACHRVLKSIQYKGWICVDLDIAREGARKSFERCGAYIVDKLEPIYA